VILVVRFLDFCNYSPRAVFQGGVAAVGVIGRTQLDDAFGEPLQGQQDRDPARVLLI
jgi:hypothetical protein